MQQALPHVVIVGGGFAGLAAVRALRSAPVRITLIDRGNHHLFQPLLYQVATAGLSAPDIAAPLRQILRRQKNVLVRMATVARIEPTDRRLELADGERVDFDYLLLASGSTHAYFGNDHWAAHAPGLKTLDDALDLRRRLLLAFERAESATDPAERASLSAQAEKVLMATGGVAPIYFYTNPYMLKPNVQNTMILPTGDVIMTYTTIS